MKLRSNEEFVLRQFDYLHKVFLGIHTGDQKAFALEFSDIVVVDLIPVTVSLRYFVGAV